MITCSEIKNAFLKKNMANEEFAKDIEDITERLYEAVMTKAEYTLHVRYEVEKAKKIAYALKILGFSVEEYRHGKLHIKAV